MFVFVTLHTSSRYFSLFLVLVDYFTNLRWATSYTNVPQPCTFRVFSRTTGLRHSQTTLVGFRPTSLSVRKCCLQQQSSGIHCLWDTELVRKQVFLQMCVSGRDLSASTLTVQHRGIMQTSSGVGLHRVNWWERFYVGFCANLAANTVMERASLSGKNSTVRAQATRFPSECDCWKVGTTNGPKAKQTQKRWLQECFVCS